MSGNINCHACDNKINPENHIICEEKHFCTIKCMLRNIDRRSECCDKNFDSTVTFGQGIGQDIANVKFIKPKKCKYCNSRVCKYCSDKDNLCAYHYGCHAKERKIYDELRRTRNEMMRTKELNELRNHETYCTCCYNEIDELVCYEGSDYCSIYCVQKENKCFYKCCDNSVEISTEEKMYYTVVTSLGEPNKCKNCSKNICPDCTRYDSFCSKCAKSMAHRKK